LGELAPKTDARRHNHLFPDRFDRRQKLLIEDVRRFNLPIGNESELIGERTALSASAND
jgi:hypothetical protein